MKKELNQNQTTTTNEIKGENEMKKQIEQKLIEQYGYLTDVEEITVNGEIMKGRMTGNDECWNNNNFYQLLLTEDGKLYEVYYNADNNTALDAIDYGTAEGYKELEIDVDYYID